MNELENQEKRASDRRRIGRALLLLPLFVGSMMILLAWQCNMHAAFFLVGFGLAALGSFLYVFYETANY